MTVKINPNITSLFIVFSLLSACAGGLAHKQKQPITMQGELKTTLPPQWVHFFLPFQLLPSVAFDLLIFFIILTHHSYHGLCHFYAYYRNASLIVYLYEKADDILNKNDVQ